MNPLPDRVKVEVTSVPSVFYLLAGALIGAAVGHSYCMGQIAAAMNRAHPKPVEAPK